MFDWLRRLSGAHVHSWPPYEEPIVTPQYFLVRGRMTDAYPRTEQRRVCSTCGLVQWKWLSR